MTTDSYPFICRIWNENKFYV